MFLEDDQIANALRQYDTDVQRITQQLRGLMRQLIPDAHEKLYEGWNAIAYSLDGRLQSGVCAIDPQTEHVQLHFGRGAELEDPGGLLEGGQDGRKARHVTLRAPEQVLSRELEQLIVHAERLAR